MRRPGRAIRRDGRPDPDLLVRATWNRLWPRDPFPRGWTARWRSLPKAYGYCDFSRREILLCDRLPEDGVALTLTVCHELLHLRLGENVDHGLGFEALERELAAKLGVFSRT